MRNAEGCIYVAPPARHKAVLASVLVSKLGEKGHPRAAAKWAIHGLIRSGMLRAEVPQGLRPCVLTEGPAWMGTVPQDLYDPEPAPIFSGGGPVPYDRLLIRSTDALWTWWHTPLEDRPDEPAQSDPGLRRRERGRPVDTDRRADQRIYDAWGSCQYRKYHDLAHELHMDPRDVKKAIDRHRKRTRRQAE
jgi:hypothetical protein